MQTGTIWSQQWTYWSNSKIRWRGYQACNYILTILLSETTSISICSKEVSYVFWRKCYQSRSFGWWCFFGIWKRCISISISCTGQVFAQQKRKCKLDRLRYLWWSVLDIFPVLFSFLASSISHKGYNSRLKFLVVEVFYVKKYIVRLSNWYYERISPMFPL